MEVKRGTKGTVNCEGNPTHGLKVKVLKRLMSGFLVEVEEGRKAHRIGDKIIIGSGEFKPEE